MTIVKLVQSFLDNAAAAILVSLGGVVAGAVALVGG
jgi:hypothetical protein